MGEKGKKEEKGKEEEEEGMGKFEEEIEKRARRESSDHVFDEEAEEDKGAEGRKERAIRKIVFFDEGDGFGGDVFHASIVA